MQRKKKNLAEIKKPLPVVILLFPIFYTSITNVLPLRTNRYFVCTAGYPQMLELSIRFDYFLFEI